MRYLLCLPLVFVLILSLGGCFFGGDTYASGSWRYKLTIAVETPEGLKTGSAVREVKATYIKSPFPEAKASRSVEGEAVVVDLGQRGVVFGLLTGMRLGVDHASTVAGYVFGSGSGWLGPDTIREMSKKKTGPVVIEPKLYPKLVTFGDPKDFRTVRNLMVLKECPRSPKGGVSLEPCLEKDSFEEVFGAGVRLHSVTIEMTDEPVTKDVVKNFMPPFGAAYIEVWNSLSFQERGALMTPSYFRVKHR
ncbi:MAG: hypothetical protein H3C49_06520 [Alphaproteobacteria bacterium]|nr:hypothetical protein [Alphaproteobacteria bacterium]